MIAESYERIHRSNLVGMGIIPLQFLPGESAETLGLTGKEQFTIQMPDTLTTKCQVEVRVGILGVHSLKIYNILIFLRGHPYITLS